MVRVLRFAVAVAAVDALAVVAGLTAGAVILRTLCR